MAKTGYNAASATTVALVATTPKSVIGVKGHANFGVDWTKYRIAFDGATSTAVPVLVELCYATFATNSPGTASTSITITQGYGRVTAAGFTAASAWTTEPTVLTTLDAFTVPAFNGTVIYDAPFGTSLDSAVAEGFVIRCTAPANVNCRPTLWFERA